MHSIWMGIAPGPKSTRVLAMAGPCETILKAKLRPNPSHPKALPTLLEAVALWQGQRVRAALCADALDDLSVTSRYPDVFHDPSETPLYALEWVPTIQRARRHRDDLGGMGRFQDLRQVVLFEVAR
jgi:hypothetical protein